MGIAPANGNRPWDTDLDPSCRSCRQVRESCGYILVCDHAGRVEALMILISLMNDWMEEVETDPVLRRCIVRYAKGRGNRSMLEICWGEGEPYERMASAQDSIRWRRFMEGMVCQDMQALQELYTMVEGSSQLATAWASGLVIWLLEITHGQWLYRCVQVHDKLHGTLITERKKDLQRQIEEEIDKGWNDLMEEDEYLAEVNLEDLENTNGERQEYWLVAICAAREASRLRGGMQQQVGQPTTWDGHIDNDS
jgi:hypothetical protein